MPGLRARALSKRFSGVTVVRDVEFTVWATTVRPACADLTVTLRVVDDRTLVGTLADGREIRLTREPGKRRTRT